MNKMLVCGGVLLLLATALSWMRGGEPAPGMPSLRTEAAGRPAEASSAAVSTGGERVAVSAAPKSPAGAPASRRSFDEIFNDLVELWRDGTPGEGGDLASATAELVTELLVAFPDAGERSLARVAAMPTPWTAVPAESRVVTGRVAQVVLDFALQRLAREPQLRARLPLLVDGLIGTMSLSREMAGLVVAVLADRPYLAARHEAPLIAIARSATGSRAFLRDPVRRLLLTLWKNLQGSDDGRLIADLLTWFADTSDGALQEAAMHRLLGLPRYRELVIEKLIQDGDSSRMLDAALHVAQHLPCGEALGTLSALQSSKRNVNLIGAYTWMAAGHGERMRQDYEECLADSITPRHREALIAAIGNASEDRLVAEASARTAFGMDPDPRVRGAAFLALCNGASSQTVADCLGVAMQDRAFASRYDLSYLTRGVRALAQREDRDLNLLDLATRFLLSQGGLVAWDREILETVRREYVPR